MGAFPYIWLLFNTTIGRVILALLAIYVIIYVFKWWSLLIAAIILIPFAYVVYVAHGDSRKLRKIRKDRSQRRKDS